MNEAPEAYLDVPLKFASYYKYTFTFEGTAPDGAKIKAHQGGDSSDIYRHEITPESVMTLRDGWYYAATIEKDGVLIYDYYGM